MKPSPPPDVPCEEYTLRAQDVLIKTVGRTGGSTVEVLANTGSMWFRFDMAVHSRLVRKYWKHVGVKDPKRLQSAVESKDGFGPFQLEGTVVGRDRLTPAEAAAGGNETMVLADVRLT